MKVILALDQGTTSSRAILFDQAGEIVATEQREFRQIFPQTGWVEHDPEEIWNTTQDVAHAALLKAKLKGTDVAAIGITNQRETTVLWDRKTGKPLHNAIVWQDRRTANCCEELKRRGLADQVQKTSGLVIDAYFSATKLRWLLENIPGARDRAQRGELAFGTIDTWLLWKLTGGRVHATDVSNASRTMLMNLATGQWDDALLKIFDIPRELLPTIRPSSGLFGESVSGILGAAVPIAGIAGDQQAALFGQACFKEGLAKNTYGTGCFMLMNVGDKPKVSTHKLLSTVAWSLPTQHSALSTKNSPTYALEGSVFIGGAVVQWLRDGLGLIKSAAEIEPLASKVPDSGGVYFVPAFAGLGSPHWDQFARGTITGLTRGTTSAHLARAALDGIAFQVADLLDVMHQDAAHTITELRVDGGASRNNLLMQIQANLLGIPVVRPHITETTALGAAYLAGLAVGFWKSRDEIAAQWKVERKFEPRLPPTEVARRRARWAEALKRARDWETIAPA